MSDNQSSRLGLTLLSRLGGSPNDIKIRAEEAKEKYEVARSQLEFLQQTAQVITISGVFAYSLFAYVLT